MDSLEAAGGGAAGVGLGVVLLYIGKAKKELRAEISVLREALTNLGARNEQQDKETAAKVTHVHDRLNRVDSVASGLEGTNKLMVPIVLSMVTKERKQ